MPDIFRLISGESHWGERTALALRLAAEKAILLAEADKKVSQQRRTIDGDPTELGFDRLDALKRERMHARNKYDGRLWEARLHADAGMVISLTDVNNGQIVGEGRLTDFDPAKATMTLVRTGKKPETLDYAKPLPVPEELRPYQSYFGMGMLVDIDVLAVPEDSAWIFSDEPNY